LIATTAEPIPLTPKDKRRRLDLAKCARTIVLKKTLEGRPPHSRWDLQALLDNHIQELSWCGLGQRTLLKLAYESRVNWIGQF
jgi:hypothetical protein